MAELDMSWTTEYQVVEDPYKGEEQKDFEGFELWEEEKAMQG